MCIVHLASLNRNYGCRIIEGIEINGYRSLMLENEQLLIHLLLDKGSEPIRWLHKPSDTDFMWFSGKGWLPASPLHQDYEGEYVGGWQEMFPEVSATHPYRGAVVHRGESAMLAWEYMILKDEPDEIKVRLRCRIRSLPFTIEKVIGLLSGSGTVRVDETIYNESPMMAYEANWGHHLAFGPPFLTEASRVILSRDAEIRDPLTGESWAWPIASRNGTKVDLSRMDAPGTPVDLVCVNTQAGRYKLADPLRAIALEVRWDTETWPYLWYWRNFNGDMDYPFFGRDYNIGLEMFNVKPKWTLREAIEAKQALTVPAEGKLSSWLEFEAVSGARATAEL